MNVNLTRRRIGRTALEISTLGFGGAAVGNLFESISNETAAATIRAAIDAGIRYFDTAPHYGFGLSERRLGDVIRENGVDDIVLSSKVGRLLRPDTDITNDKERHCFRSRMPFEPQFDYSYDGVMRSYEDSLQRLGLARIDMLLVHDIGRVTHGDKDQRHFWDLETSGYRALDELRRSGAIGAIGLGVNECEVCERAMNIGQFDCFLIAGRYTLLEQESLHGFLPKCEAYGASVVLGGPYNSGILASGTSTSTTPFFNYAPASAEVIERVSRIEAVCAEHGVTLAAAALQFPIAHPAVASVVPGINSRARVEQTIDLFGQHVPEEFWEELKMTGLLNPDAPTPRANGLTS